jgi:hypothetical protein
MEYFVPVILPWFAWPSIALDVVPHNSSQYSHDRVKHTKRLRRLDDMYLAIARNILMNARKIQDGSGALIFNQKKAGRSSGWCLLDGLQCMNPWKLGQAQRQTIKMEGSHCQRKLKLANFVFWDRRCAFARMALVAMRPTAIRLRFLTLMDVPRTKWSPIAGPEPKTFN